jgi:hypothetical protein
MNRQDARTFLNAVRAGMAASRTQVLRALAATGDLDPIKREPEPVIEPLPPACALPSQVSGRRRTKVREPEVRHFPSLIVFKPWSNPHAAHGAS